MRLKALHEKYRDRVEFLVVYVKEAHATDRRWLGRSRTQQAIHALSGNPARLDVPEPVTLEQRRRVAASCQATLFDGVVPLYVEEITNDVAKLYAARPTRIYFVGREGRVVYNPGIGPFGFSPDELGGVIEEHLAASASDPAPAAAAPAGAG